MRPTWFRSLGALLVPFLLIVCLLAGGLSWLGWRLLEQDRALEGQRTLLRLAAGADAVVTLLLRDLVEAEDVIAQFAPTPSGSVPTRVSWLPSAPRCDAIVVRFRANRVAAFPEGCLKYYPVTPSNGEESSAAFDRGEALEYQYKDTAGAIAAFRQVAGSRTPDVRAGALVRLARALRKAGRDDEALDTYTELARTTTVRLGDIPADLLARHARCGLLQQLQRHDALRPEAVRLEEDLQGGRWQLSRSAYQFHVDDARRWAGRDGADSAADREALLVAEATTGLWNEWRDVARSGGTLAGRRVVWVHDNPVLSICRHEPDGVVALVASTAFLDRQWLAATRPALARLNLGLALSDHDGRHVTGGPLGPTAPTLVRATAESGLPWTLHVAVADAAADRARSSARQRLVIAGFAMLFGLLAASSYTIARAVARELSVARMQSDFVSAVSHEFRTPLASLRQLSELLADGRVPGEERRRAYYDDLRHESERLNRLVENLLDFGRMEAGAREYRLEPLDPAPLLREVAADFGREAAARGYRVESAIADGLPAIAADREAIVRALWNLLDNAVKYSPHRTSVFLDARIDQGRLRISVRDEGLGIAREEQARIFDKFARGASANAAGIKGTGLGLAMVKHVVEGHGGAIGVTSAPGAGSTFTVTLPFAE